MRYKAWPLYNDWVIVFGRDRATGDTAHPIQVTLNNLANKEAQDTPTMVHDDFGDNNNDMNESCGMSFSAGESQNSEATKSRVKRKKNTYRLNPEVRDDPQLIEMMSTFISSVHSQIGELISKVGHEHDVSEARKNLFDALAPIPYLTVDQKFEVSKFICSNEQYLDIFYGLSLENKEAMVRKILTKQW